MDTIIKSVSVKLFSLMDFVSNPNFTLSISVPINTINIKYTRNTSGFSGWINIFRTELDFGC